MVDKYRREQLTRMVIENSIEPDEVATIRAIADFLHAGNPPLCRATAGDLATAEKELCALGKKIPAILSIRERMDIGLKEAKDMVDRYCETNDYDERARKHNAYSSVG